MVRLRHISLLAAVSLLTACATTPLPPLALSRAQITELKVDRVNVSFAPEATVSWSGNASVYQPSTARPARGSDDARSAGTEDAGSAASAEAADILFARKKAAELLNNAVQQTLNEKLHGARRVHVDVVVKNLTVHDPFLRLLIDNQDELVADATIVDEASGQPLATYPALKVAQINNGGVYGIVLDPLVRGEPVQRLAKQYGERLRDWLLPT